MASEKISESLNQHNTDKIDGGEQSSTVRRSPRISEQVMRTENKTLEKLVSSKSGGSPPSSSQKGKQTQIASDNIEISSTANPMKQTPMQQMCQESNVLEFDTAENLHSCVDGPTNDKSKEKLVRTDHSSNETDEQTLQKHITSYSGPTVLPPSNVKESLGTKTMDNVQSDNTSSEKLESSNSEVAAIAPLTETTVRKSIIVSTDVGFKDNTVANDPDESTPTPPSGCEWDSGYEFPDDHEEESVIDSDANNVLSTPCSPQTDQTTNPTTSLTIETDKEPILLTTDIETTNTTVIDIETNNESNPNSTNTDTVNRATRTKTSKTSMKRNPTDAAPKKKVPITSILLRPLILLKEMLLLKIVTLIPRQLFFNSPKNLYVQ